MLARTRTLLDLNGQTDAWPPALSALGSFGVAGGLGLALDLTSCPAPGGDRGAVHVSPRTGRAVVRRARASGRTGSCRCRRCCGGEGTRPSEEDRGALGPRASSSSAGFARAGRPCRSRRARGRLGWPRSAGLAVKTILRPEGVERTARAQHLGSFHVRQRFEIGDSARGRGRRRRLAPEGAAPNTDRGRAAPLVRGLHGASPASSPGAGKVSVARAGKGRRRFS